VRVAIRTGDTEPRERARMLRAPPHVLVTTPESLALLLVSPRWRDLLAGVRWVLVDEVHDLAPRKRGAQLALSLERLEAMTPAPPVRIGLSATVTPLEEAAAFLTGGRPCRIVHVPAAQAPLLHVALAHPDPVRARDGEARDALLAKLRAIVAAHATTIVFTNTRARAEEIAMALGQEDEPRQVETHHGSMSREERQRVEARLARGELRCVVASSSLELGLDIKSVDHVVLLGSPRSCARAVQRLGRSRHAVGERPEGTLLVEDPADLAEAFALQRLVAQRALEPLRLPPAPLDVLAQDAVGAALAGPRDVEAERALVRRAWPYRALDAASHDRALASEPYVRREGATFARRGNARMTYHVQAGTIPDDARVRVLEGERFVGEIEADFAAFLDEGDVFRLGGRNWTYLARVGRALHVAPARGKEATVPEWSGEGLGMTPLVADATRQMLFGSPGYVSTDTAEAWDAFLRWRASLPAFLDGVPAETFLHHDGRRALVVHGVAGRRAHEPLARALAHRLGGTPRAGDLGFAILGPRSWHPTARSLARHLALPIEEDLRRALAGSPLLARRFRHVAVRSFLVEKHGPMRRVARQRREEQLLDLVERERPDHPMLEEAWKEVLHDALDLAGAEALRARILDEGLALREDGPSPLAARALSRLDDDEGRAWIREAEENARTGTSALRRCGEAENQPQDVAPKRVRPSSN
jgi:ATP-dependent Lhr-like helicase